MNGSKLKIALIGTGGWARQHARILASRPEVDFCGIVGRNEERTALRAAEYKTRAYTSFEKLVKNEMPDFICVCLPNQHHFAARAHSRRWGSHSQSKNRPTPLQARSVRW